MPHKPRLTDAIELRLVIAELFDRNYTVPQLYRILVENAVVDLDLLAEVMGEFAPASKAA